MIRLPDSSSESDLKPKPFNEFLKIYFFSEKSGVSSALKSRQGTPSKQSNTLTADNAGGGRTSEQGRDYLIELDGDLLSVYGLQSLKFLDRPWNRMRALKVVILS